MISTSEYKCPPPPPPPGEIDITENLIPYRRLMCVTERELNTCNIQLWNISILSKIDNNNITYKVQNLPKNSEHTKNKKNTQKLWIKKSLMKQMHFQMSLELQEICDVMKRVPNSRDSKMKWVSPADFRLTRGILSTFSEDDRRTCGGW